MPASPAAWLPALHDTQQQQQSAPEVMEGADLGASLSGFLWLGNIVGRGRRSLLILVGFRGDEC